MKKCIFLIVLTAIFCFLAGCGPGQPFEIEEHNLSQVDTQIRILAAR